jgi:hypothetical protein
VPFCGTSTRCRSIQLLVFMILALFVEPDRRLRRLHALRPGLLLRPGRLHGALLVTKLGMAWYFAAPVAALVGVLLAVPLGRRCCA